MGPVELVDTHCHIHETGFELKGDNPTRAVWLRENALNPDQMLRDAAKDGVKRVICVGTTLEDSQLAVEFVQNRPNIWASIGIHPHEAKDYVDNKVKLQAFKKLANSQKVVAVGETGLDYYYNHSPKEQQQKLLRFHIELAIEQDLPLIFHVREAFDDFWAIFDEYKSAGRQIRGVIHSFSATTRELDEILKRGLHVGLNGIMTFTKDKKQLQAAKAVPLDKLLLETDAPYLTPAPFRGKMCQPKHTRVTAEFLANIRGESLVQLSAATSKNAEDLFQLT